MADSVPQPKFGELANPFGVGVEEEEEEEELDYSGFSPQPLPEGANPPPTEIDYGPMGQGTTSPDRPFQGSFNQQGVANITNQVLEREGADLGTGQQVTGQSIQAATPGTAASFESQAAQGLEAADIADVSAPVAADVQTPTGPTAANITAAQGPAASDIAGVGEIGPAEIQAQDQQARDAQSQQLEALSAMAGGQLSPVLEQQRERGIQNVISQLATQRGVPTAALLRAGVQGVQEVERGVQEAAARQQLEALQALGGAAGQMRGQDLGVAAQQAQLEQQAALTTAELQQREAIREAELEQQAEMQTSSQEQQRLIQQAAMEQQAEMAAAEMEAQALLAQSQFEQQANMQAAEQEQARALQQAGFQQSANEMAAQLLQQTDLQNAQFEQQMEVQRVQLEQQRFTQEASFQQEAELSNAQMEQARTIAEAQVNAQLESTRNSLLSALTQQGVSLELAEQRVDTEMAQLKEELTYRYWAAREGAIVELGKFVMEQGWFWESSGEQLNEELDAVRQLIGQDLPGYVEGVIGADPLGNQGGNQGFGSPEEGAQATADEVADVLSGLPDFP